MNPFIWFWFSNLEAWKTLTQWKNPCSPQEETQKEFEERMESVL